MFRLSGYTESRERRNGENKILGDDAELPDPASPGPHSTSGRFGYSSSCIYLIFFSKFASVMGCHLPTAPTLRNSVKPQMADWGVPLPVPVHV